MRTFDLESAYPQKVALQAIKPTVLLGVSGKANIFTKEVCEAMKDFHQVDCRSPKETFSREGNLSY